MVLFSALFATYATLVHATDGGPTTSQLFDRNLVAIETIALLLSSFVCGLAMIAAKRAQHARGRRAGWSSPACSASSSCRSSFTNSRT